MKVKISITKKKTKMSILSLFYVMINLAQRKLRLKISITKVTQTLLKH